MVEWQAVVGDRQRDMAVLAVMMMVAAWRFRSGWIEGCGTRDSGKA